MVTDIMELWDTKANSKISIQREFMPEYMLYKILLEKSNTQSEMLYVS